MEHADFCILPIHWLYTHIRFTYNTRCQIRVCLSFFLIPDADLPISSRAGFGITLIQYGLNIRNKFENSRGDGDNERARTETWSGWHAGGSNSIRDISNSTATATPEVQNTLQSTSSEWISFALMTIGKTARCSKQVGN